MKSGHPAASGACQLCIWQCLQNESPRQTFRIPTSIFFLLASLLVSACNVNQQEKSNVKGIAAARTSYLLYKDDNNYSDQPSLKGKLCLMDTVAPGTDITLLDTENGRTFLTRAKRKIRHYDPSFETEIDLTVLETLPPWDLDYGVPSKYIATKGRVEGELIPSPGESSTKNVKKIDRIIRSGETMAKAMMISGQEASADGPEGLMPSLSIVEGLGFSYTIAAYRYSWMTENEDGPRFVVLPNRKAFALTGPCSYELTPFVLEGVNYIHTGSNCCDCWISGEHILQVCADTLIREFDDYSYSHRQVSIPIDMHSPFLCHMA